MDALGVQRFSVVGGSDGAMIGIIIASLYPNSVEKLVIWGGNTFVGEEDEKIYKKHRDFALIDSVWREKMTKDYGEAYATGLWTQWIDTHLKIGI